MKTIFSKLILVCIAIVLMTSCNNKKGKTNLIPIRIGWQIPLATQGQVVQVMKNTNVLELNELKGNFISFSYGGPQSEAALAGELDVIFIGDQPAVNLISKGGKWKIVSRLFYTKTAIMVSLNSEIKSIADLKGKTVATPFGSVAHREAILKQQSAGLDADKDVNNINLDILEISNIVQTGDKTRWGNIDAVGVWEPSTSLFELKKLAKIVDFTKTLGVVAISEDFINKHPKETVKFLISLVESWYYFSANQNKVNKWYIDDAKLPYSSELLKAASSIDPNINAKNINDIDLSISQDNINTLGIAAKWAYERKFVKSTAIISNAVDLSFLNKATATIKKDGFDINKIIHK